MLFNSYLFIFVFLPLVLAVSLRLRGQALLRWIVLSSFFFYGCAGHVWFILPMLFTTVLDFFLAQMLASANSPRVRRSILIFSLCGNLGLLFYFKYSGFFLRSFQELHSVFFPSPLMQSGWLSFFDVVLPAGISFYTFQTLSYMIDVYKGEAEAETNFWKFAGFVSFFPHLVAGPLTRHNQLIPQLELIAKRGIRPRWEEGIYLFCLGLSKKVLLADQMAPYIHNLAGDPTQMHTVTAWLAMLGFSLQLYFDFSGYSDMAIGLGRLFDIELPMNFNGPYRAVNPSDFWKRWHITLSSWLRDYLYIPLGGNRKGPGRTHGNLMATMVLGGLWHGANWTFVVWGAYHGLLLVLYHRCAAKWSLLPTALQRLFTFVLVSLGWIFFRAPDLHQALIWFGRVFGTGGLGLHELGPGTGNLLSYIVGGLILVNLFPNASGFQGFRNLSIPRQRALGLVTLLALLMMNYSSRFLYFKF